MMAIILNVGTAGGRGGRGGTGTRPVHYRSPPAPLALSAMELESRSNGKPEIWGYAQTAQKSGTSICIHL
jgi:hypothetical protein